MAGETLKHGGPVIDPEPTHDTMSEIARAKVNSRNRILDAFTNLETGEVRADALLQAMMIAREGAQRGHRDNMENELFAAGISHRNIEPYTITGGYIDNAQFWDQLIDLRKDKRKR